ncbi:MAG TPA: DsbA family oxidoreductase [Burkholderiales bacterium]|nr:DsbA family oxidoreductase [Burkholderiales bacterium]
MKIEIFSDIACPWCYIAKRRLEHALETFEHRDEVEIVWRSFELAPDMPSRVPYTTAEELIHVKGVAPSEAQKMIDNVTRLGASLGLDMRFDILKLFNTRKAHELVHHAKTLGKQAEMKERLFRANFTEGRELGDVDVLVETAADIGLNPVDAREALETDRYRDAVIADEQRAQSSGAQSVPYIVFDGKQALFGAKRTEVLRAMLEQVWQEEHAPEASSST